MNRIVGIHGIAQQQRGRKALLAKWAPALGDGLELAADRELPDPPLNVAFYGDVFLRADTGARAKRSRFQAAELLADVDDEELVDLVAVAEEVVSAEDVAAVREAKGYSRVPRPLQALLRALDRRFGPSAGALYLGELRQVRRYLGDPTLKQRVDDRIRSAVSDDCQVLVGHSLGSVVAFEYIRQYADRPLELFVTIGSPLGLRMVRRLMPDADYGRTAGRPGNVQAWVNVRDVRDPVACAGDLSGWWSEIDDRHVDNEGDAHAAERYLSKRETGSAVLAALPELAR